MNRFYLSFVFSFLFLISGKQSFAGQVATVLDALDHKPIPFATIKYAATGRGTIADLDGKFKIDNTEKDLKWIEISCMGYENKRIDLPLKSDKIYLSPISKGLTEVVIKPPYDKIRRILNITIANKNDNNPDKYEWYRCKVYYKMLADISLPDSIMKDTGKDIREFKSMMEAQHLLMSETYSIRTWKRPQQLQEEVIGSRFSGLKKSMFTGLITDVLPFHAYTDYISLNGKDYHNPVSRGYEQYYKFDLKEEFVKDNDTIWVLSFKPRAGNYDHLSGSIYINSGGFAISNFIGCAVDTTLHRNVRIEQQYDKITANGQTHWFPVHLNYIIDWEQKTKKSSITYHLKGNSSIDSVSFKEDKVFRFDKAHTVRLLPEADELPDTVWKIMRPEALNRKEVRTYVMIDSFGDAKHFDRFMSYLSKLPEAKVPIGKVDINLNRLFSSNYYENIRAGFGLQTNERLIRWLSVGAWAGYGFGDVHWKYGAFAELYADKHKEFVLKAGYSDDLNDPGRVHINSDLDKNYLNSYLLNRVEQVKTYALGVKKRLGYWSVELTGRKQEMIPKYIYSFAYKGSEYTSFTAKEVSLNLRYAFAERSAPFFSTYYSLGSKYPIWYGKLTSGVLQAGGNDIPYTQAVTALAWQKHINRIGNERFLISAGKLWSNDPLPLSKLFAGNGYRYDQQNNDGLSVYAFGGMITMFPYGYYTDQFVNVIVRHDFDRKLFKLQVPYSSISSTPYIGLQYDMLYGTLQHPEAQHKVAFAVPDNAYHEVGLLLNDIIRLKYLNVYYFTINTGYFYHITPVADFNKNGKLVVGFNVEF